MPQFLFTYHGGNKPASEEEGKAAMARWKAWAKNLGPALINPGTPVGLTRVLSANGVSDAPSPHPIMGFSILEADDMECAIELLRDCPHFDFDGTLEVSEMMSMP